MRWSSNLAYVIGLITSDGCLSKDGRHIDLTSKDLEQIQTFARILNLRNKIGLKTRGNSKEKIYHRIQFGNVKFYKFLVSIGLSTRKSKTLGELKIPDKYFIDFLRGSFDGDGHTYSYWDPRWKSSFMLYLGISSASKRHLDWIDSKVTILFQIVGKIKYCGKSTYQLVYAKHSSIQLINEIYYKENLPSLKRKRLKIDRALGIIQQ